MDRAKIIGWFSGEGKRRILEQVPGDPLFVAVVFDEGRAYVTVKWRFCGCPASRFREGTLTATSMLTERHAEMEMSEVIRLVVLASKMQYAIQMN